MIVRALLAIALLLVAAQHALCRPARAAENERNGSDMIAKLLDRIRKGPRYRYRSAETGEFVSRLYAMLHPATTIRERVR